MRRISLIILLLFTISCSSLSKLSSLESKISDSKDFNDILALKYLRYSYTLKENNDYVSSKYFAKLGLDAYNRKKDFSLKLDDDLQEKNPELLADFYFLFNCWMYFETNNKNLGEATICKDSFIKLSDLIEKNKTLGTNEDSDKKVIYEDENKGSQLLSSKEQLYFFNFSKNKRIDIFFDYDKYKLNPEGLIKISSVLKYINTLNGDYKITIIGHADRIGKPIYNNTIARRRTNTVYNTLVKNGVPKDLITIDSVSSKEPKVITKQQEKNQLNRRVEIIIDTNYKKLDLNPQPI